MRRLMLSVIAASLFGCATLDPVPNKVPALSGSVRLDKRRTTQATVTEIGTAATVSLIDATSNQTIRTALTDKYGRFQLSFGSWKPSTTTVYYLEAVKGLSDNQAGKAASRVRTIARYQTTGWQTISNAVPGNVSVNTSTTALSVLASLIGTASVNPALLIGMLNIGTIDNTLTPSTPDTFSPTGTGITNSQYHQVYALVDQAIAQDTDPLDRVTISGGTFFLKSVGGATALTSITPAAAPAGGVIALVGNNFSTNNAENSLTFNGTAATPSASTPTQLTVTVPAGATSGPLVLRTPYGTASIPFTVVLPPSGQFTGT